ncbi:TPA: hypothetical protein PTV74_003215 [Clostridium botulinum]|nr:hypothetical protein [Clostridium botulinum]HDK7206370.1 hypothetical protein [Clostridium botulinum]HDK7210106.1 hypothetical protein [Clostridium botulinum]HDK7265555.1 hypothetical protein [Clostridium botulinum]HDK7269403.1 hypothetical protein [Clostridium botulinum]
MGRKCKCRICKKELTTDTAYKVVIDNKNAYYCNEEEYKNTLKTKQLKDNCYNTIKNMLNEPFVTPMMKKEINKLKEFYDYIVIEKTFKECEENIKWFLSNKEYSTEYAKIRYIITIIQNNINSVYKRYTEELKEMEKLFKQSNNETIDINIINNSITNNLKNNNDISEFLD